jgi:SAM-dependent methyltransferase
MSTSPAEEFKPIQIRRNPGMLGRLAFAARLVVDLQLLTCKQFLMPRLVMKGSVLDVGCGEMPFRGLLPKAARYTGIERPAAGDFGMGRHPEIVDFDGLTIHFPAAGQDHILCTEVLQHVEDPVALIAEMHCVLRPRGTLVATVPFAAHVHHAPYDYHRFTRYCLRQIFPGFEGVAVEARGNDLAVIANKFVVVCLRLAKPSRPWLLPLLLLARPAAMVSVGLVHLSLRFGWGSKDDPLGYGIFARKV